MSVIKHIQLKPDERVVSVYRRYGLTYVGAMIVAFILLLLPFFLVTLLFSYGMFGVIGFFALLLFAVLYSLKKVILWYDNVFVVTNLRVIDIDQRGFFDRSVSGFTYANIQDVAYRIKGVLATLFHVGTITIRPIEGSVHIELHRMRHPAKIVDVINEFREEARVGVGTHRADMLESELQNLSEDEMKVLVALVKKKGKEKAMEEFFKK